MGNRRGFTLIEILVVITIIAVLIGLLLPAVQRVREAANRTQCLNNLKQMGLALHSYHDAQSAFPPGYLYAPSPAGNARGHGWGAYLLPYLEQDALHKQISWNEPIWHTANQAPRRRHLAVFTCPTDPKAAGDFITMGTEEYAVGNYVASFGPGDMDDDSDDRRGVFSRNSRTRMADVRDGLSHTFFAGERVNGPFRGGIPHGNHYSYETTWIGAVREITDPTDDHGHMVQFQTGHLPNALDSDDRDVSAAHPQGAQFLMGDGSVHFLRENLRLSVYQALSTRAGGEPVGLSEVFQ
jgi:prepilin-type N-terminal cleavage/methylation domain-containing protein